MKTKQLVTVTEVICDNVEVSIGKMITDKKNENAIVISNQSINGDFEVYTLISLEDAIEFKTQLAAKIKEIQNQL